MNTVKVRNLELGAGIPAICIPNVGKSQEEIISLTRHYKELPMDLMEWRADWFEDIENIYNVTEVLTQLREILGDIPLLFTFRTKREGGVHTMNTDTYISLNKSVAATGMADLMDVELFTGDELVTDLISSSTNTIQRWWYPITIFTRRPPSLILYTVCERCRTWEPISPRLR